MTIQAVRICSHLARLHGRLCRLRAGMQHSGRLPDLDQRTFWGIVRAHLLNVGIIRPGPHVTAIEINVYLSCPTGAPVTVGKITDPGQGRRPTLPQQVCAIQ